VATLSAAALQSYPGAGPYRASKAALLAALEGLHYRAKGTGVTVHALCPCMVRTRVVEVSRYEEEHAKGRSAPTPFTAHVAAAIRQAEPADRFAERVLQELGDGAPFYWLTHDETRAWIGARHRAIESGAQPFSDFASAAIPAVPARP
jgi:NAD(P)-dependent dehydrogenase (short-subunit alcohol dehydrogenase family)